LDSRASIRSNSDGLAKEASHVSLETFHVIVTGAVGLTGSLDHDAGRIVKCLEEGLVRLFDEAGQTCLPGGRGVGVVVHGCSAIDEDTGVVGPLQRRDILAVVGGTSTVVDAVAVIDQAGSSGPVIDLLCPVGVSTVASVAC